MQADKEPAAAAATAAPAGGKQPSICDRLQRAFHARPAFGPLRRLTVRRHQDGGAAVKPAGAGDGASAAPAPAPNKHSGPPLLAAPLPPGRAPRASAPPAQAEQPVPVRLPAVTSQVAAAGGAPTGPPLPVPPPDVMAGMATAADAKAGETKGKTRVGSMVRKALSSK